MKTTLKTAPLGLALLLGLSMNAQAALTDISNSPLASGGVSSVKPNVLFILDDSGSMGWEYLPDSVNNNKSKFCYRNAYYNGVYYNPDITYSPPVYADGSSYPNSVFTAASTDGFTTGATTKNLASQFRTGSDSSDQPAYYYKYTGATPATPVRGTCYSDGSYTKVVVSTTSGPAANPDERENFANWYSYYRDRLATMKTAAGQAFKDIDSSFRVGFTTISYTGVSSTDARFLNIADFNYVGDGTGQKEKWYKKLYDAQTISATPLRAALAKAGRIYGGQLLTGANDPVQYSCQQNFTILSTDGYWNTNNESSSYGPDKLNGSTNVGQQDGAAPRPLYDGASQQKSTSQTKKRQDKISESTSQLQYRTTQIQQRTQQIQQASGSNQKVTGQLYRLRSYDSGVTWEDWNDKNSCSIDSSGSQQDQCVTGSLEKRTSSNSGSTWSSWSSATGCVIDDSGSSRKDCRLIQNWVNSASCTPTNDGTDYWSGSSSVDCQTNLGAWSNVSSCTPSATVSCQTTDTGWVNVTSCTASGPTNGQTITCQIADTGWVGTDACTAGTSGGATTTCQTNTTGPTYVSSCTPQTASVSNNWLTRTCTTTSVLAPTPVASCTPEAPTSGNSYVTTSCDTVTTGPTTTTSCVAALPDASNNYTTTTCTAGTGGTSDSLADVAMYYYQTDLRTTALGNCTGGLGTDVCENNVPGSGDDVNQQQHMTTFTLGLGVDGTLGYADNYLSGGSADFNAIKQGTKNWPDPISNSGAERIDDLWHAAVDGRGVYYSARDPGTLVSGISNALSGVTARTGSAAAAATSNLEPVAGDNFLFIALYRTNYWDGDLQAKTIDPQTGDVSADPIWTAQPLLDVKVGTTTDTRTIYTYDGSTANNLKPFLYASLSATEKAYFADMCTVPMKLSQCPTLISDDSTNSTTNATDASGANLVNFLRGQKGNEGTIYRTREHVLGDMVTSQPVYVRKPPFKYVDAGYVSFRDTVQASRTPTVYVAANDGMVHAFNGDTGQEQWAYIPPMVMNNMYRLADENYKANHHYYVDGSPTVADICPNAPAATCADTEWKTILVGGLNAGGRGYYALDVTDPAAPKALWNFTTADDPDLGYSFGNPLVAKRKDGTWVVVLTSGYNNVLPGDGQGYLYVLNANDGTLLEKIGTGVGSTLSPSGLAKINVVVTTDTDNTALRFYGGDLLGNLWRFTLDSATPPAAAVSTNGTAVLLAELGAINGAGVQSITTKPELTVVPYGGVDYQVVMVGTGRYLGISDKGNLDQQSVYAIKDTLSPVGLGQARTTGLLVEQTLTNFTGPGGEQLRTTSTTPVNWSTKSGWYMDFDPAGSSPGERVNVDVQLQLGSLTVATNVPSTNTCTVGGYSFLYNLDFKSGQYLPTASLQTAGKRLASNAMVAGMNTIRLQTGKVITIITDTGGNITSQETPTATGGGGGVTRKAWRELIQ
ncbi:MAG: hypothetical protein IPM27_07580 [Nitrosomonadales bacterium]|nr:hypothetical protein [Nitrosomonadales bacterium]